MKKFSDFICKNKNIVLIISFVLLALSFVGMKLTKINYDILVYLPSDIETIEGQDILTNEFNMGAYALVVAENVDKESILKLENQIKKIEGVNKVGSIVDVVGTSVPLDMLPKSITKYLVSDESTLLLVTFNGSTSSEETIDAVDELRNISKNLSVGGMSSMVLDTMNLSNSEITIYIIIAVILCIIVLAVSLDSYIVPVLLLVNIGMSIVYNLGTNILLGQISYITKALVAVLQLGVTTDFSIFLYHSYQSKKNKMPKESAMSDAISETFTSVTGSSLTTIAGFLVLCLMRLTLGKDLGIVMAKGVLLGLIAVLTIFPCLLLTFDNLITKTSHKVLVKPLTKLNDFIVKHYIVILIVFLALLFPMYKANSKVEVYYKIDETLPKTLESIKTNNEVKEKFNIVSPEIILISKDVKQNDLENLTNDLKNIEWNAKRFLTKNNYLIQTEAVKNYLIPVCNYREDLRWLPYAEEADLLNVALFGFTAKAWREANPELAKDSNIRDYASINELTVLSNLESHNAQMIREGKSKEERFMILKEIAEYQIKILNEAQNISIGTDI